MSDICGDFRGEGGVMTKRPCKVKGETDDASYGEASKAARATYWPEVIAGQASGEQG